MNNNPNTQRILCFGDSNTYGSMPHVNGITLGRYPEDVRWPGRLQKLLGENYVVLEDGWGGRTTIIDEDDPSKQGRCGIKALIPALKDNGHLDLVILMLGTNDLKARFGLTAKDIAQNVEVLIKTIQSPENYPDQKLPKILLLSPSLVDQNNPEAVGSFPDATEKSIQLGVELKLLAQEYQLPFFNIATIVKSSPRDGMHLEPEAHATIAKEICDIITSIKI